MNNTKKRTFSQFQATENQQHIDASEYAPKPKKQKLHCSTIQSSDSEPSQQPSNTPTLRERSPSIEILSIHLPNNKPDNPSETSRNDNKENKGDTNNSSSNDSDIVPIHDTPSLSDTNCSITEHKLQNHWYHFKVVNNDNTQQFKWLKHHDLQPLNVYNQYLSAHNLSLIEVSEPQYIPERIIDHQYNEETDDIAFFVKWKGFNDDQNSWEPHENLQNNALYIEYCKTHNIKHILLSDQDEDDDEDEEYEVIDMTSTDMDHDDIIDIEMEYIAAQQQQKVFTIEYIEEMIAIIDAKQVSMCHEYDAKNATEIEHDDSKWMEIRRYFETLKGELLFKAFEQTKFMNNKNKDMDIEMKPASKTPCNDGKKRRRTLFDYAFTPTKRTVEFESKPKAKTSQKKAKKARKRMSDINGNILNLFGYKDDDKHEEDVIPNDYISLNSTCYCCKRRWPLHGVEFFKYSPICNKCPRNIRLGHNRKFKEDWFCPYCIHCAHCTFANKNGDENDMDLSRICSAEHKPYLYVKPNGSNYWKTYIALKVVNTETKQLMVRGKTSRTNDIILSKIADHRILWAYCDKSEATTHKNADIDKIVSMNHQKGTVVITFKENKKTNVSVCRSSIIHCAEYLNKFILSTAKQCKSQRITFDRNKIFTHTRRIKQKKREKERTKQRFGAGIKIIESAPINSRYFNCDIDRHKDEEESKMMIENTPHHAETVHELLSTFNLESVSDNVVRPPQRRVLLGDIMKYSLVLIVGPSGSGKSTLLKDLRAQDPSKVTFKTPECLVWDDNKCIISHFDDIPVEDAMNNMSSIGLNNVRTWLKPFGILSQGERYRCAFARLLKQSKEEPDKVIVMDEFTSVLDRTNARCMSAATSKCIRKHMHEMSTFVLASANADIIRYLQPDVLILLGGNDDMKWIPNPNNLNNPKSLFQVKVVLDLPPFKPRKDVDNDHGNEYKSIYPSTMFADLVPYTQPISVTKEVRELKCRVVMDSHAKQTSTILDVEDFKGECITHIPCLQRKHLKGDFNIGVIVGPSGCGKTTSGERLFGTPTDVQWDKNRNCASHFACLSDLKEVFAAVDLPLNIGFSRFSYLSEGEQHRINIARQIEIVNDGVLIDEFTSYLDRECAKKVAKGVSDYIYKYKKKNIVFLCCKYDVISAKNGLYPSWIFDVPNKKITHYRAPVHVPPSCVSNAKLNLYPLHEFIDVKNLWNAVKIRLILKPCSRDDFAPTFSKYHYMDASISTCAKCWSVWAYFSYANGTRTDNTDNDHKRSDKEEASDDEDGDMDCDADADAYYDENELELAGFIAIVNHYGSSKVTTKSKKTVKINYREHRTVILPAFQGLGFGSRTADCIGEYLSLQGLRLHSKTAHPRYGGYRNKRPSLWIQSMNNGERMHRKQWKKNVDRVLYGGRLTAIGAEKKYFIHMYKLHSDQERTEETNQKLRTRVIVKKQYKKIQIN